MESGFSSNLTFLIAPIEAVLFPNIVEIMMTAKVDHMEKWLLPTIVVSIATIVIDPMEEVFPIIAVAITNTTAYCQSTLIICGKCEGSNTNWPELSGKLDKTEHL